MPDKIILGFCHLCMVDGKKKGVLPPLTKIAYCSICDHYFDERCRRKYFSRGLEAVKEMMGGAELGCCGPAETVIPIWMKKGER